MLEERYKKSLERVERIFEVPDLLRKLFIDSFETATKALELPHTSATVLNNQKKVLGNISQTTMEKARDEYYSILYEDTIIFIVSTAEQILKGAFNELVQNNLGKLTLDDEFTVKFEDLKKNNFETDKVYWANIIIEEIHGMRSPQEKLNFQNILAIEDLLKKYFGIKFENNTYRNTANRAHYFFQVRHILAHNAGIVNDRFVNNVSKVGVVINEKDYGKKIILARKHYDECKYVFGSLFYHIDQEIKKRSLSLSKIEEV